MKPHTLISFALGFALSFAGARAAESGHSGHSTSSAPSSSSGHTGHGSGLGRPLPPGWEPAVHDSMKNMFTLLERAEFRTGDATDTAALDAQGWIGGDFQRFWWKAEGEQETDGAKAGEFEVQGLYSRLISPFWDLQAGLRLDRKYSGPDRDTLTFFTVALEGLAPYWFEVEPALFVSEKGKVSFRLTSTYELLLTQRWVLQPRLDLNAAFQNDSRRHVASGVNDIEYGLRLRYDIKRQFSPYVGVTWRRVLGQTRNLARRAGEDISTTSVVIGLRTWF